MQYKKAIVLDYFCKNKIFVEVSGEAPEAGGKNLPFPCYPTQVLPPGGDAAQRGH